jgi:hypothetical protein
MKIPHEELIEIKHGKQLGYATINSVIPRRDLEGASWMWLSLQNLTLRGGDQIAVTTEEGHFPKMAVHETRAQDSGLLVKICIYEGLRPDPQK